MTKKLIVVTTNTTTSDWASLAMIWRRIERTRLLLRGAESDAIAVDALIGLHRPLAEVDPPSVGARRCGIDPAMNRVERHAIIEEHGRRVIDDPLKRARPDGAGAGRIDEGRRAVELRVN